MDADLFVEAVQDLPFLMLVFLSPAEPTHLEQAPHLSDHSRRKMSSGQNSISLWLVNAEVHNY